MDANSNVNYDLDESTGRMLFENRDNIACLFNPRLVECINEINTAVGASVRNRLNKPLSKLDQLNSEDMELYQKLKIFSMLEERRLWLQKDETNRRAQAELHLADSHNLKDLWNSANSMKPVSEADPDDTADAKNTGDAEESQTGTKDMTDETREITHVLQEQVKKQIANNRLEDGLDDDDAGLSDFLLGNGYPVDLSPVEVSQSSTIVLHRIKSQSLQTPASTTKKPERKESSGKTKRESKPKKKQSADRDALIIPGNIKSWRDFKDYLTTKNDMQSVQTMEDEKKFYHKKNIGVLCSNENIEEFLMSVFSDVNYRLQEFDNELYISNYVESRLKLLKTRHEGYLTWQSETKNPLEQRVSASGQKVELPAVITEIQAIRLHTMDRTCIDKLYDHHLAINKSAGTGVVDEKFKIITLDNAVRIKVEAYIKGFKPTMLLPYSQKYNSFHIAAPWSVSELTNNEDDEEEEDESI